MGCFVFGSVYHAAYIPVGISQVCRVWKSFRKRARMSVLRDMFVWIIPVNLSFSLRAISCQDIINIIALPFSYDKFRFL